MSKSNLSIILIAIGIFTILVSGKPDKFRFQELGDSLTGLIFVIIGLFVYRNDKRTRDNMAR